MILLALLSSAAPAQACTVPPPPPVVCIRKGDPPVGFERWDAVAPGAGPLMPGAAVALPLVSATASPPSCSGATKLRIAKAGNYGFALSGRAWLDVVGKNGPLSSVAHDHGPACSGIAKIVDFTLAPGVYDLRLSKAAGASIKVMAIRR